MSIVQMCPIPIVQPKHFMLFVHWSWSEKSCSKMYRPNTPPATWNSHIRNTTKKYTYEFPSSQHFSFLHGWFVISVAWIADCNAKLHSNLINRRRQWSSSSLSSSGRTDNQSIAFARACNNFSQQMRLLIDHFVWRWVSGHMRHTQYTRGIVDHRFRQHNASILQYLLSIY